MNIPAVFSSYPRQRHEGLRPIQVGVHQDRRPGWDPCLGMWNVLDSKPSRASSCSTSIWTCGWWHSRRCWRQRRLPLAGPMASESGRTSRTKSSCLSVYKNRVIHSISQSERSLALAANSKSKQLRNNNKSVLTNFDQETQERKTFRFKGFKFKRTQGQPGGPQNSLDLADAVAIQ